MYVYIKSEPQLWTVGFYQPDGQWQPESDHATSEEAAERTSKKELLKMGDSIKKCGDMWTKMALPLKDALDAKEPASLVKTVPARLNEIADREEKTFRALKEITL